MTLDHRCTELLQRVAHLSRMLEHAANVFVFELFAGRGLQQAVRASDKRAEFVGVEAYVAVGGQVMRDLFQSDDGGWLQDVPLLERLVAEKLAEATAAVEAEGWKWVETRLDFPYGHTFGLRRLKGEPVDLTEEERAAREALQAEYNELAASYEGFEELPEAVDHRFGELEAAMEAFDARPLWFPPADKAKAGAYVSVDADGKLVVARGFVRPEDETLIEVEPAEAAAAVMDVELGSQPPVREETAVAAADESIENELAPLSDRLMSELTTVRTVALRYAVGERPDIAFLAALHALTLHAFFGYASESCLDLEMKSVRFAAQPPGLADSFPAMELMKRHERWIAALPREPRELWSSLAGFDRDSQEALFAHVVGLSVNAVYESWNRKPRALAHADVVASAISLDMAAFGWMPTAESYLSRVTKARILQAVREAKGERAASRIEHLKKPEMIAAAEELLQGSGWLPEALRTTHTPTEVAHEPPPWEEGSTPANSSTTQSVELQPVLAAE